MVREQKRAWFVVGTFVFALVVVAVLVPLVGIRIAWGGLGLYGLGGLAPLLFRKKRSAVEVAEDERDKMIAKTAALAGAMMSYLAFILTCMTTWFVYMFQGKRAITIHALAIIVLAGGMVFFMSRTIAILVLYGRESGHGED